MGSAARRRRLIGGSAERGNTGRGSTQRGNTGRGHAEPVRVIHVADYAAPYTGSFVPLLEQASAATRRSGWIPEVLFSEAARGRRWVGGLEAEGVAVQFLSRDR